MKDQVTFTCHENYYIKDYWKIPHENILNILKNEVDFTDIRVYNQHKGEEAPIVRFKIEKPKNSFGTSFERVGFYLDTLPDPPSWSSTGAVRSFSNTLAEFSLAGCPSNCMYGYMCYVEVSYQLRNKGIGHNLIQWAQALLRYQNECGVALCTTTDPMTSMNQLLRNDGWEVIHERGNNNSGYIVQQWAKELDEFDPDLCYDFEDEPND